MKNKIRSLSYILIFLLFSGMADADNINKNPQAIIKVQSGETESKVPFSLNLDGTKSKGTNLQYKWQFPDKIITDKNPRPYKFTTPGSYTIYLTVSNGETEHRDSIEIIAYPKEKNGDLSDKIIINELMPNPKGVDKGQEWIELYNNDSKKVNLGNWKINDNPISEKLEIKSKGFLILESKNLPFSLKNKDFKITLKDFENKTIDQIYYGKSKENFSYSRVTINKTKTDLSWTKPSKKFPNQSYEVIKGKISTQGRYKIKVPDTQNPRLTKTIFRDEMDIAILAEKKSNTYILEKYKIKNNNNPKKIIKDYRKIYYLLIPAILLAIPLKYYNKS